jgi:hypothetical protein
MKSPVIVNELAAIELKTNKGNDAFLRFSLNIRAVRKGAKFPINGLPVNTKKGLILHRTV